MSSALESPTVSVIIPTYNHARYLGEAITSVLDQTRQAFEIIVVDDGSTDNTSQVAATFGDSISFIRQRNRGLSNARNIGIRRAKGDYIALLDADDFWEPSYLATVADRLNTEHGLGAVHTGHRFVDGQRRLLPQYSIMTVPDEAMYDHLIDEEFFAPSAVLVRHECFEHVGLFDEALRAAEDWDMWLRVAKSYRFAGIPKPLLNYRVHGENMSADPDYMLRYELMVVKKHFGADNRPYSNWPSDRQRAHANVYRQAAQGYFLRGKINEGHYFLWQALEAYPPLTQSLNLFYELGCADQPPGRRGDLTQLALERNAALLLSSLNVVFSHPDLSPRLRLRKHTAFAHAYLALGVLAYGSDRMSLARTYLWRALLLEPQLTTNRRLVPTLSKSLLGKRLVTILRRKMSRLRTLSTESQL